MSFSFSVRFFKYNTAIGLWGTGDLVSGSAYCIHPHLLEPIKLIICEVGQNNVVDGSSLSWENSKRLANRLA